ncbi:MAG: 1-phosphofructokinase [Clostridium sp.]|uniref:1-phosphofructokinase n=1 Tax=Clostridium sp. TaxID=1506 RepID=UPI0029102A50|nr:1-phosphofructokinase [Clostridium sp.]MDU4938506.1 1-phosphofructokinase [Clostridium sp.]
MIYTVTFNPSLDYVVKVNDLKLGRVNRTEEEDVYPGGKGINVSIVLKNLGYDSSALGFIAGFTGDEIERRVLEFGCKSDFIKLNDGLSRINVKIKSNEESEVNGGGPHINEEALNSLYKKLDNLQDGDILVLAGSIPKSLPEDIYEKIMERLQKKEIKIIVDATKDLLVNVLKFKPFLIKPNNHELGEIFNVELRTDEEIIEYAKKLQDKGARNVLISMAGDGAIFLSESGEIIKSGVPKGKVKNSVGAGDSMVAGFIAGYLKNYNFKEAFKMGVATGSATAFSEGLATKDEILKLLNEI